MFPVHCPNSLHPTHNIDAPVLMIWIGTLKHEKEMSKIFKSKMKDQSAYCTGNFAVVTTSLSVNCRISIIQ